MIDSGTAGLVTIGAYQLLVLAACRVRDLGIPKRRENACGGVTLIRNQAL